MSFELLNKDPETEARRGRIHTARGVVETPVFMPVGTVGTVKAMRPEELRELGAQILLANTYHLYLRPGHAAVHELGGIHRFMNWQGPILTDSGGYQVFSLAKTCRVKDDGVEFQSHLDGATHLLTPELAIDIQETLGSDILMVLDECLSYPAEREATRQSMELTLSWARRCLDHKKESDSSLYGIVQGGTYMDLRKECAERLVLMKGGRSEGNSSFDGFALGGLSVGEPMELAYEITAETTPLLPKDKPRYLMGVGMPQDIVTCIGAGIDMFDCVVPTRCGRHGTLFTAGGRINIQAASLSRDPRPVEEGCTCYTCTHYSRAYLRHLSLSKEILSAILNTIHNLHYFLNLLGQARLSIESGDYAAFQRRFFERLQDGENRVAK